MERTGVIVNFSLFSLSTTLRTVVTAIVLSDPFTK